MLTKRTRLVLVSRHLGAQGRCCLSQRVAAGSRAASIKIWNIAEGKRQCSMLRCAVHDGLRFSPIACCGWLLHARAVIKTLGASTERASTAGGSDTSRHTGHRAAITAIDFHPYGSLLATGSMDTQIKVCSAAVFAVVMLIVAAVSSCGMRVRRAA